MPPSDLTSTRSNVTFRELLVLSNGSAVLLLRLSTSCKVFSLPDLSPIAGVFEIPGAKCPLFLRSKFSALECGPNAVLVEKIGASVFVLGTTVEASLRRAGSKPVTVQKEVEVSLIPALVPDDVQTGAEPMTDAPHAPAADVQLKFRRLLQSVRESAMSFKETHQLKEQLLRDGINTANGIDQKRVASFRRLTPLFTDVATPPQTDDGVQVGAVDRALVSCDALLHLVESPTKVIVQLRLRSVGNSAISICSCILSGSSEELVVEMDAVTIGASETKVVQAVIAGMFAQRGLSGVVILEVTALGLAKPSLCVVGRVEVAPEALLLPPRSIPVGWTGILIWWLERSILIFLLFQLFTVCPFECIPVGTNVLPL